MRRNAIFHRKRKNQPKESSLWTTKRRTFKTSQKTFNVISYYIFYIVREHMLHICSTHIFFFVQKNNCFNKQSQGDILSTALLKPQAINGPYFLLFFSSITTSIKCNKLLSSLFADIIKVIFQVCLRGISEINMAQYLHPQLIKATDK